MSSTKKPSKQLSDSDIQKILKSYRHPIWPRVFRITAVICLVTTLIGGFMSYRWLKTLGVFNFSDQDLKGILEYKPFDNSVVFDRHGQKIGELFSAYYIFIPYDQFPKRMIEAVVAIEDRNFYEHSGIDLKAIVRASLSHLRPNTLKQGASTITQQVVRNFLLTQERSLDRKIREITLALLLEKRLSKEQIMELYLNALFLGNGAYGVGAAAQRYFGKKINELEDHEMALIAGLFQSPSGYNPQRFPRRAKRRQLLVIRSMVQAGKINMAEARAMAQKPLKYQTYQPRNFETAPYFVDHIRERTQELLGESVQNRGLRIHTTLDSELQRLAHEALDNAQANFHRARLNLSSETARKTDAVEAAMLVTDRRTNQILAMFGGRHYHRSQFNRTIQARRAPGSAFKPVVYSLALHEGYRWSDMVYVTPIAVDDYRPRNYSQAFLTEATLLRAFYQSINTPVVELGQRLGLNNVIQHAEALGIRSTLRREAGTFLGSSEVSMLEMATAYSTFANGGIRHEPISILKITDRDGEVLYEAKDKSPKLEPVISPQVAYLMTEGMRSVFRFGTAQRFFSLAEIAVGKTGTTNDARDNWFCGYTSDLVAVVWSGTDDPEGFRGEVSATTISLPLWSDFIQRASRLKPPKPFEVPEGIANALINPHYGHLDENGVNMFFLEGQVPQQQQSSFSIITRSGNFRNIFDR